MHNSLRLMDKKLKKKVETQLVITMQGILSRINNAATENSKKKIREAGKMVARRFAKAVATFQKEHEKAGILKSKAAKKKNVKKNVPVRNAKGRFQRKKK